MLSDAPNDLSQKVELENSRKMLFTKQNGLCPEASMKATNDGPKVTYGLNRKAVRL